MSAVDPSKGSWYEATARERIARLLDPGGFEEFIGPEQRVMSPHLPLFGVPRAFDDGVIVGRGTLDRRPVLVAAQEGRFMGGTFGEVGGAKITGLLRAARVVKNADRRAPVAVLFLLDTGGVRLQEANAGELAIAEVMRAVVEARAAGVAVIGLIGGRAGCFGGGGLIAAACGKLVISEPGRIGVSGPEVIETNAGVEEFDSKDRPLVWRTLGGRTRRLIGNADLYVEDSFAAFREAAIRLAAAGQRLDRGVLQAEQERLEKRLKLFGECGDAVDMWRKLGLEAPDGIADLADEAFVKLAGSVAEANHDAR